MLGLKMLFIVIATASSLVLKIYFEKIKLAQTKNERKSKNYQIDKCK